MYGHGNRASVPNQGATELFLEWIERPKKCQSSEKQVKESVPGEDSHTRIINEPSLIRR